MSGLFHTFSISRSGMQAAQTAVNTASHNIANASTEGYSRQTVNVSSETPYTMPGIGQLGNGVKIDSITRTRDQYLDAQIRYENSVDGKYESSQSILQQVETIFMEPSDTGLNEVMNRMWTSWQELSKSPENSNVKTVVVQDSIAMTDTINHMSAQLETIQRDAIDSADSRVFEAAKLTDEIYSLNEQIISAQLHGVTPNDLMDKRDLAIDKMSSILDVNVKLTSSGAVEVTSSETGAVLVDANPKNKPQVQLAVVKDVQQQADGSYTISFARGGDINDIVTVSGLTDSFEAGEPIFVEPGTTNVSKAPLKNGYLAGNKAAIDKVKGYSEMLDSLASDLATAVNKIHSEIGGVNFFESSDGASISAGNLSVNANIAKNVNLIETGKSANSPVGDGSRALAIAQLRNGVFPINDGTDFQTYVQNSYDPSTMSIPSSKTGTSFDGYYKDIVAKTSIDVQSADRGKSNQENLLMQLNQRKESLSGVSIDEEVANLVQMQTSYQANAKVMSTVTMMIDTLIHDLGL